MLIHEVRTNSMRSLKPQHLCETAGVSRSGYYAWCKAASLRAVREERDLEDYLKIAEIFYRKNQKAGWRVISMDLEDTMNHKKIRRLMKKYNLQTKVRRSNPYRKLLKATQEHKVAPNLLARKFKQTTPGKVLLTDITYLYYGKGQKAYLSAVKDLATREILAYHISSSLSMDIVLNTLDMLKTNLGPLVQAKAMIHSDQGFHYTHPEYQHRVKTMHLSQSMSRRGNCLDNAPMESFFGHFKDEVDYRFSKSLYELKSMVHWYIHHYNYERCQWTLEKMTPVEYRSHLITA